MGYTANSPLVKDLVTLALELDSTSGALVGAAWGLRLADERGGNPNAAEQNNQLRGLCEDTVETEATTIREAATLLRTFVRLLTVESELTKKKGGA